MGFYVGSTAELEGLCQDAVRAGRVGVDAEFIPERTFYPKLALVQLAVADRLVLVDPLGPVDLAPFDALMGDPSVCKVFHAAGQDLDIFVHRRAGEPPKVDSVLGVSLTKGASFTDWLRRPLTREQEQYALDDVRYLLPLHDELSVRLERAGRMTWALEEIARYEDASRYQQDPASAFRRVKGAAGLAPLGLAVLREVAAWRELEARSRDCPRRRVVGDEVLVQLAHSQPRTPPELSAVRGLHPRERHRSQDALLAAVARGLSTPAKDRPEVPRKRRAPSNAQVMVEVCRAGLTAICEREGIGRQLVGTTESLEALVADFLNPGPDAEENPLLNGWRGDLVGRQLLGLLEGRLCVGLDPTRRTAVLVPITGDSARPGRTESPPPCSDP